MEAFANQLIATTQKHLQVINDKTHEKDYAVIINAIKFRMEKAAENGLYYATFNYATKNLTTSEPWTGKDGLLPYIEKHFNGEITNPNKKFKITDKSIIEEVGIDGINDITISWQLNQIQV